MAPLDDSTSRYEQEFRADKSKIVVDRSRDALITDFGKATLNDRYLMPGESYQDMFARVSAAFADDQAHAQRLYDYMSRLWFMPATPVLSNGGTKRGLPISCFLNEANDSLGGIVDLWNENVWLASKGGGIGSYWGNLRSLGERVGDVGKTSGIVPFIHVMDSMTLAISQGSLRRGSAAVYLPISHPEIEEFIEIRRPTGGDPNRKALNLHNGIVVSDAFMRAVEADEMWDLTSPKDGHVVKTVSARSIWIRILTARIETGEPYLIFSDAVNSARPEHQKLAGLEVKLSNLCVAPETMLLTRGGYRRIDTLSGCPVEVWNGTEWSQTQVVKTGSNQKLITVRLDNGMSLPCTPYHKFYVKDAYHSKPREVRAIDLKPGDMLIKTTLPEAFGSDLYDRTAYSHGFFCGDGTYGYRENGKRITLIRLYGEKKLLADRLMRSARMIGSGNVDGQDRLNYQVIDELPEKFEVPINHSVRHKIEWLAGLVDADGCVTHNGSSVSLQIGSVEPTFLRSIQLMLQTLGVASRINLLHEARVAAMPNHRGGQSDYSCRPVERILIGGDGLRRLVDLGFAPSRVSIGDPRPNREATHFARIESIEDDGRIDDTYCVNEPMKHLATFNGILTGNCTEITLPTGLDHHGRERTAVCCLSSLNLETWFEWNQNTMFIEDVMRFLDNVLQTFIDNAPDTMEKARYSAMRERSIGLGVMGFHSFLQDNGLPFESAMAKSWNMRMFRHIRKAADEASVKLADEKGACPDAAEYGIHERFSNKLSIAPTASISIIAGNASPGIEPIAANVFLQKTLSGSFAVKNRALKKLLADKGRDTDAVWSDITLHKGSVQHLDFLTEDEKAVFRTAFEIDQRWIIEHAADRTPFICQSQSVNLFLPANIHKRDLHQLHLMAWKKGMKSLYYCRSLSIARPESRITSTETDGRTTQGGRVDYEECLACQ